MKYIDLPLPTHARGTHNTFGVMVHTTGNGLAKRMYGSAKPDHEVVHDVYRKMTTGPHFAIVPNGRVLKFRDPSRIAWHVGMPAIHRTSFLNGSWRCRSDVPGKLVSEWLERFPKKKSPVHLYPSKSPNKDYIGIELVPAGLYQGDKWIWNEQFPPPHENARFTLAQYLSLAYLTEELCWEYEIPIQWSTGRIVGHEDVNPIRRPGWDPGHLYGYFSWDMYRELTETLNEIRQRTH